MVLQNPVVYGALAGAMDVRQFVFYDSVIILILGTTLNFTFIYMVRYGTRRCVSPVYKNIMTCFAVCNIAFSSMAFIAKPGIHIYGTSVMAYCNGIFKRMKPWGFLSLCVFLGLYGMNTALLALHFVYRYIAVCRQNLLNIFHNTSSIAAVIMSVFSWGLIYGFITFYCFAPNEHYYKYANQSVYETFGVDPHTISFFCVFTHEKKEGATIIHWPSTIGLCIVFVMMIITFTLMMVCGIKMHRTLKQSSMSPKARKLQNQMLKALALQIELLRLTALFASSPKLLDGFVLVRGGHTHTAKLGSIGIKLYKIVIAKFDGRNGKLQKTRRVLSLTPIFVSIYTIIDPIIIMFFVCDYRLTMENLTKNLVFCRIGVQLVKRAVASSQLSKFASEGTRRQRRRTFPAVLY